MGLLVNGEALKRDSESAPQLMAATIAFIRALQDMGIIIPPRSTLVELVTIHTQDNDSLGRKFQHYSIEIDGFVEYK